LARTRAFDSFGPAVADREGRAAPAVDAESCGLGEGRPFGKARSFPDAVRPPGSGVGRTGTGAAEACGSRAVSE